MKNFRRKKQVLTERPYICGDGSIQWGGANIKFDVSPDLGWDGGPTVDFGSGSYGCTISWKIAPPTGTPGLMWPDQKKVDDIESVFDYLVNELNVDEKQALRTVNDLAPIVRNMGRRGPKNPMPKPTPTYDYPEGLDEVRKPKPLNEEKCGGGGGGGYDKYSFTFKIHPDSGGSVGGVGGLMVTCKFTITFMIAPPTGGGTKDELIRRMTQHGIPYRQVGRILSRLEREAEEMGRSSVTVSQPMNMGDMGGGCPGHCEPPQVMDANCNCVDEFSKMDPTRNPFPGPVGPAGPLPSDIYI